MKAGERIIELQNSLVHRVKQLEVAIAERKEAEKALLNLTLTDDLTGLYNRRGFFTLSERKLMAARRTGQSSLLFYADLDGLKMINDTLGHQEGSAAITTTAEVLGRTFRNSDIVARLGGDEFAILAQDASESEAAVMIARIDQNLCQVNAERQQPYQLSLSVGAVFVDYTNVLSIDQLICLADKAMYEKKRSKQPWHDPVVPVRASALRGMRYEVQLR